VQDFNPAYVGSGQAAKDSNRAIAWQDRSTPKFQLRKNRHCSRNADFVSRIESLRRGEST
jgi:hypothetical protein